MIIEKGSLLHWNYFLALENDLEKVARYIEFNNDNFAVYSIELAHLLLASASEVDVVAKEICQLLGDNPENINGYRTTITSTLPGFVEEEISISRYGLTFKPWSNWKSNENQNPLWWRSYNHVKHERNLYFSDANLKNVLNALGGLLITVFYYYKLKLPLDKEMSFTRRGILEILDPKPSLLKMKMFI